MNYKVLCVDVDEDADVDDCRRISRIGYQSFTVLTLVSEQAEPKYATPEEVHEIIEDGDRFFIDVDGERTELETAETNGTKYVRSEPNDTSDDNLLEQPACDE